MTKEEGPAVRRARRLDLKAQAYIAFSIAAWFITWKM
jgi:hypothetical protein